MSSICYRELGAWEITAALFRRFNRYQEVRQCWRKIGGQWVVRDIAFTEQWDSDAYERMTAELKALTLKGGIMIGAFDGDSLAGFAAVENSRLGFKGDYVPLPFLYVSYESRGLGLGRALFERACLCAKLLGGQKLYISAHSSVESQAFYRAMGCVEAEKYDRAHVEREPCDVQMEYVLA